MGPLQGVFNPPKSKSAATEPHPEPLTRQSHGPFSGKALFALELDEFQPRTNFGFLQQVVIACCLTVGKDLAPAIGNEDRRLEGRFSCNLVRILEVKVSYASIFIRQHRERQPKILGKLAQPIYSISRNREHLSFLLLILVMVFRDLLKQLSAFLTFNGAEE